MGMTGIIARNGGIGGAAKLLPAALRALFELIRARIRLARLTGADIAKLNHDAARAGRGPDALARGDKAALDLVGFVIPGLAPRLPWRSDCLIQAMAAQRWLRSQGIASEIVIGADKTPQTGFTPHAWLRCGDRIVTGGEIGRYKVLLEPEPDCPEDRR